MVIHNGQPTLVTGWYVDAHGHQLFLTQGSLAPICPHQGPNSVLWRLLRQVANPK